MTSEASVTVSLPEAARLLGISESLARQLARRGEFPGAFRLGGRVLVHRQVFAEELERLGRGQPLDERDPDRVLAAPRALPAEAAPPTRCSDRR
jgi:excisionase family DNA binding protein